jgi:WD40 repeat protein/DNA-binding SARP family transcriptional activator/class 3 adenylate cyclase/ABC-type cobalamin/Fe3+-siderophores transport system ATPase subunit
MDDAPEQILFRVLGPFEVVVDGCLAPLGGARQRLVLAGLVANANAVVSTDRLIDIVWGDEPPTTALSTTQKYVHRLRTLVGNRLVTRAPGYLLRIDTGETDASRFESLLAAATRLTTAGELRDAIATFDEALGLWRGPAWAEFGDLDFARVDVARLDGLRATAIDDRMEVALAAGRHAEVIGELEATVALYPLRERPRSQLMLALYRSGCHAEAIRAYDAFRRYLGEEVGLEPSASLAQLADAILLRGSELDWVPPPGARGRPALPSGVVTFLFSDIEDSTRLFRQLGHAYVELLERHRRLVRAAVAAAPGAEVNSEGDGLFFAFSEARAALGASVAAQRALAAEEWPPGAEIRVRMGLHTGEATPHDGDYIALAVHQAARVKDAAHGGQVLLTEATVAAIGGDVPADCSVLALGTFLLRDFDGGVGLFEGRDPGLLWSFPPPRIDGDAPRTPPLPAALAADTEPLIGRTMELEWLEVLWQRAVAGERVIALVHGPPGMGKSRLLGEFARHVHAGGATVTVSLSHARRGGTDPLLAVLDAFDGATMEGLAAGATGVCVLAASRQPINGAPNKRELGGLSPDEVGLLLGYKLEKVTPDLSSAIQTETHGNPGQVHDVARRLRDREAEERVQRALERVGAVTEEARALRDAIAGGVLERERLAALAPEVTTLGVCPYKGLARYETADAPFFFGRERLVATLVARLAVNRFVGIIGASGSGKSSLVRAGLLSALAARALPGSDAWPICTYTPGEHPLRSFAQALAPLVGVPATELARRLDRQPDELGSLLEAALHGRQEACVVVVVDQFEEIVTLCRDQEERERFAGALVDAVTDPDVRATVVVVVRADYYGALAVHSELARLFEQSQLLVGAMTHAELRRAITEPARRAGLALYDGMVDAVYTDAASEPGALPLVSTAMAETWERRDGTTLTLAAYREAGGVHGALARLADDVYASLDDSGGAMARRLFLRLAEPREGNDDVRRRMPREEFSAGSAGDDVLDAFVGRRLLVADGGSIEVAHEALLREWPRLRAWLEEDRDGRRLHRHLTEAAAAWIVEGRDQGALYRGTRLGAAQDWANSHRDSLNAAEREFLDASASAQHQELQSARRTARRLRSLAGAMAALLVIALLAGGLAFVQRSRANHQAATAHRALVVSDATRLAIQARSMPLDQLDLALLLAVQGRHLQPSDTTDGALESVLTRVPPGLERIVNLGANRGLCADVSPDGRHVADIGGDGVVRLYDTNSGQLVHMLRGNVGLCGSLRFSDDSTQLVAAGTSGTAMIWDVATGHEVGEPIRGPVGQTQASEHLPGRLLVSSTDGTVRVWDTSDPHHFTLASPVFAVGTSFPSSSRLCSAGCPWLAYGDSPNLFAVSVGGPPQSAGAMTQVWDIASHRLAYPALPGSMVGQSPDGGILVTATDNQLYLWDTTTGTAVGQPISFSIAPLGLVVFTPDGSRLVVPEATDNAIRIIDVVSHLEVGLPILGVPAPGGPFRLLADGRIAMWVGVNIAIYRVPSLAPAAFVTPLGGPTGRPVGATFAAEGTRVETMPNFTGAPAGWDPSTGRSLGPYLTGVPFGPGCENTRSCPGWDLSPDGALVAIGRPDGTVEIWDAARATRDTTFKTGQQMPEVTWSQHEGLLATGGNGGTVALWDVTDPMHVVNLARASAPGFSADSEPTPTFSPDGKLLAAFGYPSLNGSGVSSVDLLAVPSLHPVQLLHVGNGFVVSPAFSPDSKEFAVSEIELSAAFGRVIVWDTATWSQRATLQLPYEPAGIVFVAGGAWLATTQVNSLGGPEDLSRVDLWDAVTLQPIGDPIMVRGDAGLLATDRPGGYRFASGSTSPLGTPMVWDVDPAHWDAMACRIAGRDLTRAEWNQYLPGRPYQATCPTTRRITP